MSNVPMTPIDAYWPELSNIDAFKLMQPSHPAWFYLEYWIHLIGYPHSAVFLASNLGMSVPEPEDPRVPDVDVYLKLYAVLQIEREQPDVKPSIADVMRMSPREFAQYSDDYAERVDYALTHFYGVGDQ